MNGWTVADTDMIHQCVYCGSPERLDGGAIQMCTDDERKYPHIYHCDKSSCIYAHAEDELPIFSCNSTPVVRKKIDNKNVLEYTP